MTGDIFLQLVVNGLSTGLLYVLAASGLVLVLGVGKIFNFAHGEFYMLGAYSFYVFYCLFHINPFIAIVLAALVVGLFGIVCYRTIFQYMRGSLLRAAGATIGIGMIMRQAILQGFGTSSKGIPSIHPGIVTIGNSPFSLERLALIGYCLVSMLLLYLFLMKTKLGMAMRVTTIDSEAARLQGINDNRIYILAIAAGCCLAGLAGAIVAPIISLSPGMGHDLLFMILMVLILGGMQSVTGAVLGGLILGLTLSFGYHFFGNISEVYIYVIIAIIVAFKPHGLLGKPVEV